MNNPLESNQWFGKNKWRAAICIVFHRRKDNLVGARGESSDLFSLSLYIYIYMGGVGEGKDSVSRGAQRACTAVVNRGAQRACTAVVNRGAQRA